MTDHSLVAIFGNCRKLTSVDISGCCKVQGVSVIRSFCHLRMLLYLQASDEALLQLSRSACLSNLRHLNLFGCIHLTDAALSSLTVQSSILQLHVSVCSHIPIALDCMSYLCAILCCRRSICRRVLTYPTRRLWS